LAKGVVDLEFQKATSALIRVVWP